jgi:hypothetical protein
MLPESQARRSCWIEPQLPAHFEKKRFTKTAAQRNFGAVQQFYDVVSVKERMQTPYRRFANKGRPVCSNKFSWIELVFEALDCLPQDMRSGHCVNHDIFIGCVDPNDLFDG